MINLGVWNIKGVNSPLKYKEIKLLVAKHKMEMVVILETKVRKEKSESIRRKLFGDQEFIDNYKISPRGKIWVSWNQSLLKVNLIMKSKQPSGNPSKQSSSSCFNCV